MSVLSSPLRGDRSGAFYPAKPENVLIYPNPNNGSFSIAYTFEQNTHIFELYDILGKKVSETQLNGTEGVENMSLIEMKNGIYFYKVLDSKGKMLFTGKLMIHK